MKRASSSLIVIHLLALLAFGQDGARVAERDLWRTRADILTRNILKNSEKDVLNRALLMAELSDLWWASDPIQANAWIEKSVDALVFYPAQDVKDHRQEFFSVARATLSLISSHNKKQARRLDSVLSKSEDAPDADRKLNAEGLIEQALKIVKDDPRAAATLGQRALSLGFPSKANQFSWALRRNNPELADDFVRTALASVASLPDRSKLFWLELILFPENLGSSFPATLRPPANLKVIYLSLMADYLYNSQLDFSRRASSSCSDDAAYTVKFEKWFAELLPQKLDTVRQLINICLGDQNRQIREQVTNTSESSDFDELLKKADENQDSPLFRSNFLIKAAAAALRQKMFAKSVEILDKMTDEERKVNLEYWEDLRYAAGGHLAATRFIDGDVTGAERTLKEIPDMLRPLGNVIFVLQFSADDISSYQTCVNVLGNARAEFAKSDLAFDRKSFYWLNLVKLYSNYKMQAEASETLKEVIRAFNSSLSDNSAEQKLANENQFTADLKKIVPNLSLNLFETREDSIFESISLIKLERPSKEISLQFLAMVLKRYESLKLELDKSVEKPGQGIAPKQRSS